eukprot:6214010-Pleurochrysis_carterae.AAC.3
MATAVGRAQAYASARRVTHAGVRCVVPRAAGHGVAFNGASDELCAVKRVALRLHTGESSRGVSGKQMGAYWSPVVIKGIWERYECRAVVGGKTAPKPSLSVVLITSIGWPQTCGDKHQIARGATLRGRKAEGRSAAAGAGKEAVAFASSAVGCGQEEA